MGIDSNIYGVLVNYNSQIFRNITLNKEYGFNYYKELCSYLDENKPNSSLDIHIEDISILFNNDLLTKIYEFSRKGIHCNIYTNDIMYREMLSEIYGNSNKNIVAKYIKRKPEGDYLKETLYINQEILNNHYEIYDTIEFFEDLYKVDMNDTSKTQINIFFYTKDKLQNLFNKFAYNIEVPKKTGKYVIDQSKKIDNSNKFTEEFIEISDEEYKDGLSAYTKTVDKFLKELEDVINSFNKKINKKFSKDINISKEKYNIIKNRLLELYKLATKTNRNLRIKTVINIIYAMVMGVLDTIKLTFLHPFLCKVYFTNLLRKKFQEICPNILNLIYAGKISEKYMDFIRNNVLFLSCIEALGEDILFAFSYLTGIQGCNFTIDGKKYLFSPPSSNPYLPLKNFFIELEASIYETGNIQYLPRRLNAALYAKNDKIQFGNEQISVKECMLRDNIKNLKYMLYMETPSYFMPYIDSLLESNFNLESNTGKNNAKYITTGKFINLIVLTSLHHKWQESFIKKQIDNKYGSLPVRHSIEPSKEDKKRNFNLESYKDYDIILKNEALENEDKDVNRSTITFLTYFYNINLTQLTNDLRIYVDNCKNFISSFEVSKKIMVFLYFTCDMLLLRFKMWYRLQSKIENLTNIFENFNQNDENIYINQDYIEELIDDIEQLHDECIELYSSYFKGIEITANVSKEELEENFHNINKGLTKTVYLLSLVKNYFFSTYERERIDDYIGKYDEVMTEHLENIVKEEQIFVHIEKKNENDIKNYKNTYKDTISALLLNNPINNEDKIITNLIKITSTSETLLLLNDLRLATLRLQYKLDKDGNKIIDFLNSNIKLQYAPNIKCSDLVEAGKYIIEQADNLLKEYPHFAGINISSNILKNKILKVHNLALYILKKAIFSHIFLTDELIYHGLYDYADDLFYIGTAVYFSTQFHNHQLENTEDFINNAKKYGLELYYNSFKTYVLEELYIVAYNNFSNYKEKYQKEYNIDCNLYLKMLRNILSYLYGKEYLNHGYGDVNQEDNDFSGIFVNKENVPHNYISKLYLSLENERYSFTNTFYEQDSEGFASNIAGKIVDTPRENLAGELFSETKDYVVDEVKGNFSKDKVIEVSQEYLSERLDDIVSEMDKNAGAAEVIVEVYKEIAKECKEKISVDYAKKIINDIKDLYEKTYDKIVNIDKVYEYATENYQEIFSSVYEGIKDNIQDRLTDSENIIFSVEQVFRLFLNRFLQTMDNEKLKMYSDFIKYTYLTSPAQRPLVKAGKNELILPGTVYNNMMLFDYSYSIFGGSRLDMSSFIDTESIYTNVFNSDIANEIFTERIEVLVLGPLDNRNSFLYEFWNKIEINQNLNEILDDKKIQNIAKRYVECSDIIDEKAEIYEKYLKDKFLLKRVVDYVKEGSISARVEKYKLVYEKNLIELLKNIYIVGYFLKNKVNNQRIEAVSENDFYFEHEKQRANQYKCFVKALHNIGRTNLRSVYIDYIADVAEWKYKFRDKQKLELDILQNNTDVCHLDYAGVISILPIETSEFIKNK